MMRRITLWLTVCVLFAGCARSGPQSLEQLIESCGKGDRPKVEAMLAKNPGLAKASRADGYTALHEAIMTSKDDLIVPLLQAGANPNQVKANGNQPLHSAVHKLKPESVAALVAKGALVDGRAPNGDTPLIIAAAIRRLDMAEVLLTNKADINAQNTETAAFALYHAVGNGHTELVKFLLNKGANPNLALKSGSTALHVGTRTGQAEVVKLLLAKGANPNLPDQNGATPLTEAVVSGQLALVDLLLKGGADPGVGVTMQLAQGRKEIQARLKAARPRAPKGPK